MNKKIIKLLSFVFVFFFLAAASAFAQEPGVKIVTKTAYMSFGIAPKAVTILHSQEIYVLQHTSYTVNAQVVPDSDVTISSIQVQYRYSTGTVKAVHLTVSTDSYNSVSGFFTSVAGSDAGNRIITEAENVYYRIAVYYSQLGMPEEVGYSAWKVLKNPKINLKYNRDIARISPYQRRMVVIGNVSDASVSDIRFNYRVNGSVDISSLTLNGKPGFASEEYIVPDNAATFSYRVFTAYDSDYSRIKYYPYDLSWVDVPVIDYSSMSVSDAGATLILDNEDRRYGYSNIVIPPNALSAAQTIKFTEMDMEKSFPWQSSSRIIKVYRLEPATLILGANAAITLYADELEDSGKYSMKYWNGSSWKDLNTVYNPSEKTVTANNANFGYYAIFDAKSLKDSDYRPEYRLLKFGEKMQFRNLQEGDIVTIFDLKGRQIRRITAAPFEWDGRRDSGGYAESGSYIYQIKVSGKIISGSIAFVR